MLFTGTESSYWYEGTLDIDFDGDGPMTSSGTTTTTATPRGRLLPECRPQQRDLLDLSDDATTTFTGRPGWDYCQHARGVTSTSTAMTIS